MEITAIILIAGKGLRMLPKSLTLPKCLLKVGNESILEHQIRNLTHYGIKKIVFCVGYLHEIIIKKIKTLSKTYNFNFQYIINNRFENTNTLYSLNLVLNKLKKNDYIYLNGDVVFDKRILQKIMKSKTHNYPVLFVEKKKTNKEEVKVVLDKDGYVIKIGKEINNKLSVGEFTGIFFFPKQYFLILAPVLKKLTQEGKNNEYFEYGLQHTIDYNSAILVPSFISPYKFIEIDTKSDYEIAKKIFSKHFNFISK